jgi:lysosomal Pro-X carboxypeptidase
MCSSNLLASWPLMQQLGLTADGRSVIAESMGLCDVPGSSEAVEVLIQNIQVLSRCCCTSFFFLFLISFDSIVLFLKGVFFDMAEGDYPFPSTYITSAVGPGLYPLPAWPMQVACESLNSDLGVSISGDTSSVQFTVKAAASSTSTNDVTVSVDWDSATAGSFSLDDVQNSGIPGECVDIRILCFLTQTIGNPAYFYWLHCAIIQ